MPPSFIAKADVSNAASVASALDATLGQLGRIDILVNNAGVNGPVLPTWDYPEADFDRVVAIDLKGVFLCARAVLPHMRARKSGRIVTIASIAGKEGVPGIAAYSAAKGGAIAFTKALAKEVVTDGILVNCIAPSLVETDLFAEMTPEHIAAMRAKVPMGRLLQVDEVARMVCWVVGPGVHVHDGLRVRSDGGSGDVLRG